MKTNYHTHTERCHHAHGSDEAYVLSAIEGGFKVLGFSDHCCWKYADKNFKSRIRMSVEEFDDYYNSIIYLKEKYKDQIDIKIGMEAEYFPKYLSWMKEFVKEKHIDYLILGNHYFESDEYGAYYGYGCEEDELLVQYANDIEAALKTGLYSYVCHPDLFMRGRSEFDDLCKKVSLKICNIAKELDIPLEYNLAGLQVSEMMHTDIYPHPKFWEIAASVGNKVIIGVDAHDNRALSNTYYYDKAVKTLEKLGMERVENIDYKF